MGLMPEETVKNIDVKVEKKIADSMLKLVINDLHREIASGTIPGLDSIIADLRLYISGTNDPKLCDTKDLSITENDGIPCADYSPQPSLESSQMSSLGSVELERTDGVGLQDGYFPPKNSTTTTTNSSPDVPENPPSSMISIKSIDLSERSEGDGSSN